MTLKAHPEQTLAAHLNGVAKRAADFAKSFDAERQAEIAGLLHDLGKAEKQFQARINGSKDDEKHPHAPHGAALALDKQLWPVAFAINGHHAGLHDRSALQQVPARYTEKAKTCLCALEAEAWTAPVFTADDKPLPKWLEELPFAPASERIAKMRAVDFYTRMLFSALVDADRLDTENANLSDGSQTNNRKRKSWRFGETGLATSGAIESLQKLLDDAITTRIAAAKAKRASAAVLNVRAEVLAACRERAPAPRGVFSLKVPTGGGKTLASLAFALAHAKAHGLRRIIIVIPYLNIIQQTSFELRTLFGDLIWKAGAIDPYTGKQTKHAISGEMGAWLENHDPNHCHLILEHHSQASDPVVKEGKEDGKNDADGWDKERSLRQLAAENWDAPIIVTTSVQFFDSLFSRRPADARKLHNICQSVVIFDEVQTLPPLLLQPILDALKELAHPKRPYGCSLVLCTATQPALNKSEDLAFGFDNTISIIPDEAARRHFIALQRVNYRGLQKDSAPTELSNDQLATAMLNAPQQQALAILNTRKQARSVFDALKSKAERDAALREAVFHLSTWMYPAHRLAVLTEATKRLSEGKPCLLVSTQCVEAGVDVDFPAVWRAFGPYDSIVQAAGRCNRNGTRSAADSIVTVFTPADGCKPGGVYESAMQNAELLRKMGLAKPDDPASFETYFRLLYQTSVPDPGGCAIQSAREKLHFKEVGELFNFIDADTVPLLIESAIMADGKYVGDWCKNTSMKTYFTVDEWRAIQPFIVGLAYPSSEKTRGFLEKTNSELVFKGDDPLRGLRRMKATGVYLDGLNGAGLDFNCQAFGDLSNYIA